MSDGNLSIRFRDRNPETIMKNLHQHVGKLGPALCALLVQEVSNLKAPQDSALAVDISRTVTQGCRRITFEIRQSGPLADLKDWEETK